MLSFAVVVSVPQLTLGCRLRHPFLFLLSSAGSSVPVLAAHNEHAAPVSHPSSDFTRVAINNTHHIRTQRQHTARNMLRAITLDVARGSRGAAIAGVSSRRIRAAPVAALSCSTHAALPRQRRSYYWWDSHDTVDEFKARLEFILRSEGVENPVYPVSPRDECQHATRTHRSRPRSVCSNGVGCIRSVTSCSTTCLP